MHIPDAILRLIEKYKQTDTISADEKAVLQSWFKKSPQNKMLFEERLANQPFTPPAFGGERNNGSANAFEATENPFQQEKDISDKDIDERVSDEP